MALDKDLSTNEQLVRIAALTPSLGLRIDLADPNLPSRQAARARRVLAIVGVGDYGGSSNVGLRINTAQDRARLAVAKQLEELCRMQKLTTR